MSNPRGARGPAINGRALRAFRIEAGHTQTSLGEAAGISGAHICRLESGNRTYPSPRLTRALADTLGVTVRDLLAADLAPAS